MAKIDPKSLTLDSRQLLGLSVQDRLSFFKTPEGQSYLASLTPIEYNRLLSSYHQKQLAPLTGGSIGSVSGGAAGGGAQTATPSAPSGRPSAAPSGPSATPTPAGPQQPGRQQVRPAGPTVGADTRLAWEKRLEELANQARGQQQGQQQQGQPQQQREISTSGLSTPELTRRVILETARNRGWSKEGTAALLGMTRQESNFNPYVIGDGGRSHGIFQVANNFGSRGKESRLDRFVSIAKRKTGLDDPLKYIRDVKSGKIKPDPTITRGLIESSIEHFVDNDVDSKINSQNVQRALKSTNPVEATEYLLRATRPKNWNEQGKSGWEWSKRLRNTQNELPGVTKDLEQQIKEGLSPGVSPEEKNRPTIKPPDGYENLPEDIRKAIDELPESRRNKAYDNLRAFSEKHSNWIETYTQAHKEAIDQGANSQEVSKNIAETASVSPNSAASVAPPPLPGTTQEVQGDTVFEKQQGATRKLAINPNLKDKIEEAVLSVYGPGYKAEVYSGGQPEIGTSSQRKGGTRHDTGKAADIRIRTPDGKILAREQQVPLVQYWASKGYGGIGIGMDGGGLHLDSHKTGGNNAWGYRGNTNSWNFLSKAEQKALIEAKKEGFVAPISRQEFSDYSKRVAERTNALRQQGLNATQARQQARTEVREQINQTIREKEAAAATQTAPVVPTQTQQPVSPGVNPADAVRTGGSGYTQGPTRSGQTPGSAAPAAPAATPPAPAAPAAPAATPPAPAAPAATPPAPAAPAATPSAITPAAAQTAPTDVPATPTAEPVKEEKPPEYADGGEQQLDPENLSVVDNNTGEVQAKFNSSETAVFNRGRMEVTPASRDNSVGIEDRTNQILQQEQNVANQQNNQMEMPQQNAQLSQSYDSGYNKDWDAMMNEVKQASSDVYKNPTAARAYDAHRFASSGDVFKHFSFKTPTIRA